MVGKGPADVHVCAGRRVISLFVASLLPVVLVFRLYCCSALVHLRVGELTILSLYVNTAVQPRALEIEDDNLAKEEETIKGKLWCVSEVTEITKIPSCQQKRPTTKHRYPNSILP